MSCKRLFTALSLLLSTIFSMPDHAQAALSLYHTRGPQGISAHLLFESTPLVTMRSIPFVLVVKDTENRLMRGLTFDCSLTMPAMPMPPNHPESSETTFGYVGRAIFTMEGAWQATFTAKDKEDGEFELIFDIPMVLLK